MYAYPHLMCATFLFTRNNQASQATTIDQLINALGHTPTNNYRLVGNLDSSWALPGRLLSSHQDSSNSQLNVAALALHAYENVSFESVRKLARLCDLIGGENHCLDGTFDSNPDMPAILFAHKQAQALFGYSEQLFLILKNGFPDDYNDIQMISLPSGTNHNQPLFSTDAYVFRRNMSNEILNAARSFVEFMATPHMQAAIVASGDSPYPSTIPRYLLPISNNAYRDPLLVNNRFYQHYFRNLTGFSMPNIGFLNTRKQLQAALLKYIK
jgi:thiamine pyridinylase